VINDAYCKLQVMSKDEANRMIYEAQRDEYSRLRGARQEGREEEKLEIARNFKNLGVPVEQVAQATGLSPEEIAVL
jgi:predicted transposase/invertase (TIGR01784 family)